MNRDSKSLPGRIRIGMALAGIRNGSELARRMKVNRQTVHRWLDGQGDKLTPEMLFKLGDALNVNVRWLALGGAMIAYDIIALLRRLESDGYEPDEVLMSSEVHKQLETDVGQPVGGALQSIQGVPIRVVARAGWAICVRKR